jgi:hypothetical protein
MILTVEQWEEMFKPLPNHLDPHASWTDGEERGLMYETYGNELDYVNTQLNKHVWTWVDTDEGDAILSGKHWVNRIGYFITENPWTEETEVQVN